MNKFKVKTGDLKLKVSVGKMELIKKNGILQKPTFVEEFQMFAKINHLLGSEYYSACAVNMQNTEKLIIRYNTKITINHIIKFKDKYYSIIDIDNVEYQNEWLVLKIQVKEQK